MKGTFYFSFCSNTVTVGQAVPQEPDDARPVRRVDAKLSTSLRSGRDVFLHGWVAPTKCATGSASVVLIGWMEWTSPFERLCDTSKGTEVFMNSPFPASSESCYTPTIGGEEFLQPVLNRLVPTKVLTWSAGWHTIN